MTQPTWLQEITDTLNSLGGQAFLEDLYKQIQARGIMKCQGEWKATVRNTIETHSSSSTFYNGKNPDLFASVDGLGSGHWMLRPK
ncbi:MAG TPA: hypothetical protein PKW59_12915 [Thermotogota bacterium]|nr:hypothetical protein [Thermotogota bacterium]HQQ67074.1 hypothetical protein [Thermotogota bacterium]